MRKLKKNIILYIGHTYDLAYFYRLIPLINNDNKFRITSILAKGPYFDDVIKYREILERYSDEIIEISAEHIPVYSLRIIRSLKNIFRLRKKIMHIDFMGSVLISHDKSQFMANYLLSHFKKVVLIQTLESNDFQNNLKLSPFRMIYYNLLNFLSWNKLIVLKEVTSSNGHAWHYKILNPHFEVVYRNNQLDIENKIILPSLEDINPQKKILIFGGRFTEWAYLKDNRNKYISIIKSFYLKLYKKYSGYEFYYKPHPKEGDDEYKIIKDIFNNELINLGKSLNSELFLLNNRDIGYCYSICSTSSLSAYELGFNSRTFYRLLKLKNGIEEANNLIYQDMPNNFFVNYLNDNLDIKCNSNSNGDLDYINRVLNNFYL
jgi:hypothetical protein